MEPLCAPTWEENGLMVEKAREREQARVEDEEGEGGWSEEGFDEEETDGDSEPEHPPAAAVRRKVSFADAFGLDLVSVVEFDSVDVTLGLEVGGEHPEKDALLHPSEEFYFLSQFVVPSTVDELEQRLREQMLELESVQLLPGTSTIRGIIRVVNLCFRKAVYVRITQDRWGSHFDLLAEYVPGSSDRKTDRFAFQYPLVPPLEREGVRVEFCLRYETSVGTFWANNLGLNYVLFCHQRAPAKGLAATDEPEDWSCRKSKRSCLKANRRENVDEKNSEDFDKTTSDVISMHEAEEADEDKIVSTDLRSILHHKEHNALVANPQSHQKAEIPAIVQDYKHDIPKPCSALADFQHHHHHHRYTSAQQEISPESSCHQSMKWADCPQILTYHQIPLLTLDWSSEKPQHWGTTDNKCIEGITNASSIGLEESTRNTPPESDVWEAFLNATKEGTDDKASSVCDTWQAFLNGPDCKQSSGLPESEWLQTAASFSAVKHTTSTKQQHVPLAALAERRLTGVHTSSSPSETSLAPEKSEGSSVTETRLEFGPARGGSDDRRTQRREHATWGGEREEKIVREGGSGGPLSPRIADLVISSGETGTTEMTALRGSQNASALDRISQAAGPDECLSCGGGREVTGSAREPTGDAVAFRETIRRRAGNQGRSLLFPFRHEAEDGFAPGRVEIKARSEEIFRSQRTQETRASQRYADEVKRGEFGLNRNSGAALGQRDTDETGLTVSHADEIQPDQLQQEEFRQGQIRVCEDKWDYSNFSRTNREVGVSGEEAERQKGIEIERNQAKEETTLNSSNADMLVFSKAHDKELKLTPPEEGQTLVQTGKNYELECHATGKYVFMSRQTGESINQSHCQIFQEKQEPLRNVNTGKVNAPAQSQGDTYRKIQTVENPTTDTVLKKYQEGERIQPVHTDKHNPITTETGLRRDESQEHSLKEDLVGEIRPQEEKGKLSKKDSSTELQHSPDILDETLKDMSRTDKYKQENIGAREMEDAAEGIGDAEDTQAEGKTSERELKEQEVLVVEVEGPQQGELEKLAQGSKYPIAADHRVATAGRTETGLEDIFADGIAEDLFEGHLKQVLNLNDSAHTLKEEGKAEVNSGGKRFNLPDVHGEKLRKNCKTIRAPVSLSQGQGQSSVTGCVEAIAGNVSLTTLAKTGQPANPYSIASLKQAASSTDEHYTIPSSDMVIKSEQTIYRKAVMSIISREEKITCQSKERSVSNQEMCSQLDSSGVDHRESFDQSTVPCQENSEGDNGLLVWLGEMCSLGHVTRTLVYALLVFIITLFYDIPACFAFYALLLCWFCCQWRRQRMTLTKDVVG